MKKSEENQQFWQTQASSDNLWQPDATTQGAPQAEAFEQPTPTATAADRPTQAPPQQQPQGFQQPPQATPFDSPQQGQGPVQTPFDPVQKPPAGPSIGTDLLNLIRSYCSIDPLNGLKGADQIQNKYTWIILAVIFVFIAPLGKTSRWTFLPSVFGGLGFGLSYLYGLLNAVIAAGITCGAYFIFKVAGMSKRKPQEVLNLCFASLLPVTAFALLAFLAQFAWVGLGTALNQVGRVIHWMLIYRALQEEPGPKRPTTNLFFLAFILVQTLLTSIV
jgi:hypothetical protein